MKTTAIASWYGSNRLLGEHVGKALEGCEWVGVPFMGGGAELAHIRCRTGIANDLHKQIINLSNVIRHPALGPMLIRDLRRLPVHAIQLWHAQQHCIRVETRGFSEDNETAGMESSYMDALNYFVCCWMGRNGKAGTDGELNGGLSIRWEAGGGDSAVRFRSATESLRDWRKVLARWTFTCVDAFEFLKKCKDQDRHGLYCDPPWADDGEQYRHKFTEQQQRDLARVLSGYKQTRVVVRYGDHPLIRELYPESHWTWNLLSGRTAANKAKAEVLLVNRQAASLFDAEDA